MLYNNIYATNTVQQDIRVRAIVKRCSAIPPLLPPALGARGNKANRQQVIYIYIYIYVCHCTCIYVTNTVQQDIDGSGQ